MVFQALCLALGDTVGNGSRHWCYMKKTDKFVNWNSPSGAITGLGVQDLRCLSWPAHAKGHSQFQDLKRKLETEMWRSSSPNFLIFQRWLCPILMSRTWGGKVIEKMAALRQVAWSRAWNNLIADGTTTRHLESQSCQTLEGSVSLMPLYSEIATCGLLSIIIWDWSSHPKDSFLSCFLPKPFPPQAS